jgi:hypothetical protein
MLATKCLSLYQPRSDSLARALTTYHNPFAGANRSIFESSSRPSEQEVEELVEEGEKFGNSALEVGFATLLSLTTVTNVAIARLACYRDICKALYPLCRSPTVY